MTSPLCAIVPVALGVHFRLGGGGVREGGGLAEGVVVGVVGGGGVVAADRIDAIGGAFPLMGTRPGRVCSGRHGLCD